MTTHHDERQRPLFPPDSGIDTSVAAAHAVAPTTPSLRKMVFDYLDQFPGGLTERELEDALNIDGNTIRPRLWELEKKTKQIQKTQKKRLNTARRPGAKRCFARVYKTNRHVKVGDLDA